MLPIIQPLSGFEWPHPLRGDPKRRDKSRFCEYHKTNSYFQLRRLLNYLVSKGHLQEYVESLAPKRSPSLPSARQRQITNMIHAAPNMTHAREQSHARIFMARVTYSFSSGSARPVDGLLPMFNSSLRQLAQPHHDALILTLKIMWLLMKHILVDSGSATDLLYFPALIRLGYTPKNLHNLGRILVWFNDTQTHSLREIVLPISTGPVTALVPLTVIDELLNFNAILGHTWIHAMKALPSSYHQRLSFLTSQGQVDTSGDQQATQTCFTLNLQDGDAPLK